MPTIIDDFSIQRTHFVVLYYLSSQFGIQISSVQLRQLLDEICSSAPLLKKKCTNLKASKHPRWLHYLQRVALCRPCLSPLHAANKIQFFGDPVTAEFKSRHEVMPCSLSPAMKSITNSQRNARCVLGIWDVGKEINQALNKQVSSKEFSITKQVFLAPLPDTCDSNLSFSAHVKLRPIHIYINSRQHPPILNPVGYSWYRTCLAAKACHWLPARRTLLILTSTWLHHVRCPLLATTHERVLLTPPIHPSLY